MALISGMGKGKLPPVKLTYTSTNYTGGSIYHDITDNFTTIKLIAKGPTIDHLGIAWTEGGTDRTHDLSVIGSTYAIPNYTEDLANQKGLYFSSVVASGQGGGSVTIELS